MPDNLNLPPQSGAPITDAEKSKKVLAGVLGIFLGAWGVHKFVLGYTNEGLIYVGVTLGAIVLSVVTCGIGSFLLFIPSILGLVEAIIYLTKSDEEFVNTYVRNKKSWF